ncbi:HD-GYP domain-containing protein [Cohnella sp. AR92]|uniref:HD-GYP domain-containing protein n=1 Tax=Cohnella sp. AR92 TaxID=648716 RepID=UPI001315AD82|nr:HD domain-containing phosphohydrolase [Cohnella sp. AR92]
MAILDDSKHLFMQLSSQHKDMEWEKGKTLFLALQYRCQATADHSLVVAFAAYHLCLRMDRPQLAERMFLAGLLHDIGKLTMPDDILKSSRKLSEEERLGLIEHVQKGVDALTELHFGDDIIHFCQSHHERLDGSGYPQGIPEESFIGRIAAISDVYSAMKMPRLYRLNTIDDEGILNYLSDNPQQFDNDFLQQLRSFLAEWNAYSSLPKKVPV